MLSSSPPPPLPSLSFPPLLPPPFLYHFPNWKDQGLKGGPSLSLHRLQNIRYSKCLPIVVTIQEMAYNIEHSPATHPSYKSHLLCYHCRRDIPVSPQQCLWDLIKLIARGLSSSENPLSVIQLALTFSLYISYVRPFIDLFFSLWYFIAERDCNLGDQTHIISFFCFFFRGHTYKLDNNFLGCFIIHISTSWVHYVVLWLLWLLTLARKAQFMSLCFLKVDVKCLFEI